MKIITVENAIKSLDNKEILRGVNLNVVKGDILSLVGPSGSGKSTLLRCINRLLEIDQGVIKFNDKDIKNFEPVFLRRKIVLVHQDSVMLEGSVFDNVSYGLKLLGSQDVNLVRKCMSDVGLSLDFLDKSAGKLSGGERKRVALARALCLKPEILLLDEPTSGVDPKNIEKVERNIVDFSKNRKLTVLWVTHYVEQAKRVSDRIANLKDGIVKTIEKTTDFVWEGAY
jgi:putative ABC transport system ATP-binding protein